MTLIELINGLLDGLPKCCECNKPATHIESAKGTSRDAGSYGKEFSTDEVPAKLNTAVKGSWTWQLCDDHSMPSQMAPIRKSGVHYAASIRHAYKAVAALKLADEAVQALKVITGPSVTSVFPEGNVSFFDAAAAKRRKA